MSPLVSLFGGSYAWAAATSAYERRWTSPLVFPLVPWLFFFDILCAPLIAAHEALLRFCADIISLGVIIISPTTPVKRSQFLKSIVKHFSFVKCCSLTCFFGDVKTKNKVQKKDYSCFDHIDELSLERYKS